MPNKQPCIQTVWPFSKEADTIAHGLTRGILMCALKKVNDQAEHFERLWYLRGDELETIKAQGARVPDDIAKLLCSVADNLGDMPVSDAWASRTAFRAHALIEQYGLLSSAPTAPQVEPVKHWTESEPVRLASSRAGRVYIAGPMTGIAEFNFPAFNSEAAKLRAEGLSVLNPAEHGIVEGAEWEDYLRHDIAGLASCERIHFLPGWEKSKGARLEYHIACNLGMTVTYADHTTSEGG